MELDDLKEVVAKLPEDKVTKLKKDFYLESKTKGVLDGLQEKIVSRKLLVFGTATALLVYAGLDADTWGMIAMMYIGGQSAIDFAKVWKG
jgi:hypothetical protein